MSNDENHARQESELIRQARQQIGIDSTKRQTQDTEGQGTVVRCPHCGERIPLQTDMGHDLVRCPSCENEFNLLFEVETASFSGKTPKALGHYQLLEHLGMGQYGSVWKALDTQLDRVVALKIPRRTELAPGESEIFLREARAAAQLKHPHIVSVHEIGQADGVVYISSDFVRGANLREWLGDRILTATEAAEVCAKLANALEHAHQAGVIHRDLKPANIMVDLDGEPHVMDFGMAKRSTGEVTVTMEGQIIGTPAYMSPEQARGEAHGVDGRADIYSLGVILFELLTGERPFRGEKRMLMVQIISDAPPSPRKYNSHIPKDLETICLKCLEKTPVRRYATAGDVETDLRRWLNREPIQARPISRLHRVVRWCQRRPAVAALLALVLLVTALGFSLVTWQWRLARAQYLEAVKQQQRGDRYFGTLLTAVDEMLVKVGAEQLQDEPRMESARRSIVEQALEYYDWLISEEGSATELRPHLARARLQAGKLRVWLGDYVKAEEILVQYLEDLRLLPTDTLSHEIGADAEAEGRLELAKARIKLGKEDQAERDLTQLLQAASAADRESDDSKPQLSRAAAASLLGELLMLQERNDEAEKRLKQALDYLNCPKDVSSHEVVEKRFEAFHFLAICYTDTPRFRESDEYFRKALDLRPLLLEGNELTSRRSLAYCLADYALYLEKTDQPEIADEIRRQTIELQQQMVRDYPEVPDIRRSLAVAYQNLGASLAKRITQQDWTEAEKERLLGEADAAFQKAVGLLEELHSLYPEVPDYADVLAGTFNLWSSALTGMGRAEEAVECLEKARNFWKQRLETNPDDMNVRSDYGGVLNNLAYRYRALEKLDEARAMAEEAIVHQEQARAASPENTKYLQYLATHYLTLGRVCRVQEEMAVAIPAYRKALDLHEELHEKLGNEETRRNVGGITSEFGIVQFRMKDATVADREEALKLMRRGYELVPENSVIQYNLGVSLTKMERWDEVLAVLKDMPDNEAATRVRRTWSAVHMALALGHQGKIDAANDRLAQARTFAEALEIHDEIDTDIAEVEQLLKQSGSSSDPSKDDDEG